MAIIRLDPFSPFRSFFRPVSWDNEQDWPEVSMTEGLDVYEEGDSIVAKAAVPGIPADKVEVTYEDGVLRIKARYEESEEEKKKKKVVYRREKVSSFNYTTVLPRAIDEKSIEAEVSEGVVTIRAHIAEQAKPKKIEVKSRK